MPSLDAVGAFVSWSRAGHGPNSPLPLGLWPPCTPCYRAPFSSFVWLWFLGWCDHGPVVSPVAHFCRSPLHGDGWSIKPAWLGVCIVCVGWQMDFPGFRDNLNLLATSAGTGEWRVPTRTLHFLGFCTLSPLVACMGKSGLSGTVREATSGCMHRHPFTHGQPSLHKCRLLLPCGEDNQRDLRYTFMCTQTHDPTTKKKTCTRTHAT